jgi:two-component system, chemotaxis family, response regulator Rcp1
MSSQIVKPIGISPDRPVKGAFGRWNGRSSFASSLDACPSQTKSSVPGWTLLSGNETRHSATAAGGSNQGLATELASFSSSQSQVGSASRQHHVLLVEDNPADVFMVQEAFREHDIRAVLHIVQDGEDATRFIDAADTNESAPTPELVLLDLNLPKRSGTEVLAYLRRSKRSAKAKVLIVTSSNSPLDRAATQQMGIIGHFLKPPQLEEFLRLGEIVEGALRDGRDS